MYRLVRIRLNEEIVHCTSLLESLIPELGPDLLSTQLKAEAVMTSLSDDICYSVPFFINPENPAQAKRTMTMYGGISVLRPLMSIAETNRLSPDRLLWVAEQINRISVATGVGPPWFLSKLNALPTPESTPETHSSFGLQSTPSLTPEADVLASTELCALSYNEGWVTPKLHFGT